MRYAGAGRGLAGEGGKAWHLRQLDGVASVPRFVVFPAEQVARGPLACVEQVLAAGLRPPLAVRSSADAEDSTDASFAGMFETQLDIGQDELAEAIATVAGSGSSPRLRAYLGTDGAAHDVALPVHVIVQEMVDAEVAGVCLTRLDVDHETAAVEAVWGLGDELVSGRADPDLYLFDRGSACARLRRTGNQIVHMRLRGGRAPVPGHLRRARKLDDERVREVAETAIRLERHFAFRHGADMEWAFAEGRLWVLQVRALVHR